MPDFTQDNVRQLATAIVDGMDLKTLIQYAVEQIEASYIDNNYVDEFNKDWEYYFGDD